MKLTAIDFSKNYDFSHNPSIPQFELPFIKIILEGKKGETTQILRKVTKSNNYINNHVEKLLLEGFNGTKEDFDKLYGKNQANKRIKSKGKIKLNNNILLRSDFFYKPMQKTIPKEFKFANNRNIDKNIIMKNLFSFRNNISKDNNKKILKKNKSAYDINSKNLSISNSNFYKTSIDINNQRNNSMIYKEKFSKMKKIKRIRKLLNEKSRNLLKDNNNIDFQKSSYELIKENNEKEDKSEDKKINLDRIEVIKSIILKSEKKKKESKDSSEIINKTFQILLNEKEDDKVKFKKILDPLSDGFKGQLKEVKKNEGKERYNIWIKRSTANLVSFGNAFQLIADDQFYKERKRIVSKYPDIERQANIIVPSKIEREGDKIIEKMEDNERLIRNIVRDKDSRLKNIEEKYIEINRNYSKSHPSIKKKKKFKY